MVYFMNHHENTDKNSHKNTIYSNHSFIQDYWQLANRFQTVYQYITHNKLK